MRLWDQIPPEDLCNQHLLAQWREGLGLWSILTQGKAGYRNHPETKRWVEALPALYDLLAATRSAMLARGWAPKDLPGPRPPAQARAAATYPEPWDDQVAALLQKGCGCRVSARRRGSA